MTRRIFGIVTIVVLGISIVGPDAQAASTARVSVGAGGVEADASSDSPVGISGTGRFVAFPSDATNLVTDDTNGFEDIFVRDRRTHTTAIVSRTTSAESDGDSQDANISADGRFVAFESTATNLIGTDANGGTRDIFVADRLTGEITLVSQATGGVQSDGASFDPSISATGRFVAFISFGTNLVASDTNGVIDVFVRDLVNGTTVRASVDSSGVQSDNHSLGPAISGNGDFVAFSSSATNLVAADANTKDDIFVRNLVAGTTTRVSVATGGTEADSGSADPSLSEDGRLVVFQSDATNLVSGDTNGNDDVFLHDMQTGKTTRISVTTHGAQATGGESVNPVLSANGRFVVYASAASNLVASDTNGVDDIFVRDRKKHRTSRVSTATNGTQSNGDSFDPVISSTGKFVAFGSEGSTLVPNDTNGDDDIFVRRR